MAVLGLVAAACGGDEDTSSSAPRSTGSASTDLSGGTLKMAMLADVTAAFDPQKEYYSVTWEYYRCCLLRTLMSYKGVPTDQGGAEIFPDLASAAPEVSADGLDVDVHASSRASSTRRPFEDVSDHGRATSSARSSARRTRRRTSVATRSTTR